MHEVRLGGLSLPRKSAVRLTDRPDMTLDVYRGRKTATQQQQLFFLRLWEMVQYRLKYCLKEPLSPTQPSNQQDLNNLCEQPNFRYVCATIMSTYCTYGFFSNDRLLRQTGNYMIRQSGYAGSSKSSLFIKVRLEQQISQRKFSGSRKFTLRYQ